MDIGKRKIGKRGNWDKRILGKRKIREKGNWKKREHGKKENWEKGEKTKRQKDKRTKGQKDKRTKRLKDKKQLAAANECPNCNDRRFKTKIQKHTKQNTSGCWQLMPQTS